MKQKQALNKQKKVNYLPIQNLVKIEPKISSLVISPVNSPKYWLALLTSKATNSVFKLFWIPLSTSLSA